MTAVYHTPVLLQQCLEGLNIRPGGIYVDATFGGGGHSHEIFKRLTTGRLFAFDIDPDVEKNAIEDSRFILIKKNFCELQNALLRHGITEIDGLMADLGVSSHQFDSPQRGFSTRWDSKLDMRMNQESGKTAAEIIRTYPEEDLQRIFKQYGELRRAAQIAMRVAANHSRIQTVNDLKNTLAGFAEKKKENQFYAKVFQALRIEVNDELNVLKELLMQSKELLKPGGRIAMISYHSLEDRIVKTFFRFGNFEKEKEVSIYGENKTSFRVLSKKPIVPAQDEIANNSRARSAKLRIAEKI